MKFDFDNILSIEFGVGRDDEDKHVFHQVMVSSEIQSLLVDMVRATWAGMQKISISPSQYEPSEKYSTYESLILPLSNPLSDRMQDLHTAVNIDADQGVLDNLDLVFCYFVKLMDKNDNKLTAVRRSTQFKGLRNSTLMASLRGTDELQILEEQVLKLDSDFDLLIDDESVFIYRPSGFEFVAKLKEAILAAVTGNISRLSSDLAFVNFDQIEGYANTHSRAARYLASICTRQEVVKIDQQRLVDACHATGVVISSENGEIVVEDGNVMGFLEVLDRRRYEVKLIPNEPEHFIAPSRNRLKIK